MDVKNLSFNSLFYHSKVWVLYTGFLLFSLTLHAQTYHSGEISSNETWSSGIHIITGTVTVLDGITLTISPNSEVKFNSGTGLSIYGILIADGSDDNRIHFTSNQIIPAPGDFGSIGFSGADPGCLMDYCEIEYGGSSYGNIYVHASGSNVTVSNTTIRHSEYAGVYINDQNASPSTPYFDNCTFYSNATYGLASAPHLSYVALNDCSFENNGSYAFNIFGNSVKNISGTLNITGNGGNAILVNGDNSISTGTWANWNYDYIINGDISVIDNETLTIAPGSTLKFNGNYVFTVNGALIADGDDANHITFTSNQATPTPGYWKFISFYAPDSPCVFDYCDVSYAGAEHSGSSRGNITIQFTGSYVNFSNCTITNGLTYGVKINDSCNPAFTSCEINNNGSYGIYCTQTGTPPYPSFSDCNIHDNGSYPLYLFADNAKDISSTMTFTGNAVNKIYLQPDDINTGTWTNFGIPYVMGGDMLVPDGETLTIAPGNTLKFNGNYVFTVNGTLIADGDAANHITFTSNQSTPTPGYWKFISFYSLDGPCIFDYCDVSYAGAEHSGSSRGNITMEWTGNNVDFSNCTISNGSTYGVKINNGCNPAFTSCDINNNGSYGIYCTQTATTPYPSFSDCNFEDNGSYPLYLFGDNAKDISSPMTFTGNAVNKIYLQPDNVNTGTWTNFGIPYVMGGDMLVPDGETLTIAPGNTLKFNGNYIFTVNGTLIADGDAANHITFTSNQTTPTPGFWKFISFYAPDSPCIFDYCDVSYAGAVHSGASRGNITMQWTGSYVNFSNCSISNGSTYGVKVKDNSNPAFTYCDINNNGSYGIYCTHSSATYTPYPTFSDCSFLNNGSYPLYLFADNPDDISAPMTFSGNGYQSIYLQADQVNTGTWPNVGIPYILGGEPIVPDGETLTIAAGNTIKFNGLYRFLVYGGLIANGTSADHITFTSNQATPSPGDWYFINVYAPDFPCDFNYCDVSYGGALWGGNDHYGNILLDFSGNYFDITNCTIEHSASNGAYIKRNCNSQITSSTIQDNADSGIYSYPPSYINNLTLTNNCINNNSGHGIYLSGQSFPTFGSNLSEWNDIHQNTGYEIYNNTTNDFSAEYIYWGTLDYAEINNDIYDQNDNGSLGLVDYIPWTNAAHDTEYPVSLDSPVVTITIESGNANLDWDDVPLATSYKVYSDTDPYGTFTTVEWEGADTCWSEPAYTKKFYYVTAVN